VTTTTNGVSVSSTLVSCSDCDLSINAIPQAESPYRSSEAARSLGFQVFDLHNLNPLKSIDARSSKRLHYDSLKAPEIVEISSSRLKGHKRKSSIDPPHIKRNPITKHICPVTKCKKMYSRSERLREHIRSSKDTEHQKNSVELDNLHCKKCGRQCASAGGLTKHKKWCKEIFYLSENPHQPPRKYTFTLD